MPDATPPLTRWRFAFILAGPLLAIALSALLDALVPDAHLSPPARITAAFAALMAFWWITEAIPLPVTSLLPLVCLPWLGVLSPDAAAAPYANRIIFLFMGGFMLALAMERWGLHRRIAMIIMLAVGSRPPMLVGGFMLATAIISMWVSNTATAVMMLPTALSVIAVIEHRTGTSHPRLATCILLGIAYAASIGGIGTPIGTPPNAFLHGFLEDHLGMTISFARWMAVALPIVLILLPLTWLLLTRVLHPLPWTPLPGGRDVIRREAHALGPPNRGEIIVASTFALAVILWIFRGLLAAHVPALGFLKGIDDSAVALLAAIALFLIPVNLRRAEFALDWPTASKLPWGVLLLFGGGLSLAQAMETSGLAQTIGAQFTLLADWPAWLIVLAIAMVVVFLSELASNTAIAAIFITLLAGIAPTLGQHPLLLIVPATLASSLAFMLPAGTPPNAIVFGTGRITVAQMARAGFLLNLISIAIVTIATFTLVSWILLPVPASP